MPAKTEAKPFMSLRLTSEEFEAIDALVRERNESSEGGRHSRQSVVAAMVRRGLKERTRKR